VCGTPERCAGGSITRWTTFRLAYPLKPSFAGGLQLHPFYVKSTDGPVLGSKSVKLPCAHSVLIAFCRSSFLLASMKHVAFQLFRVKSLISSFKVSLVSLGTASRSSIVFLFLNFHIAHIVIEIRIRSLSESLLELSSNVKAVAPLIRPIVTSGHALMVVFCQMSFTVSQARFCPLFLHSVHMCILLSMMSMSQLSHSMSFHSIVLFIFIHLCSSFHLFLFSVHSPVSDSCTSSLVPPGLLSYTLVLVHVMCPSSRPFCIPFIRDHYVVASLFQICTPSCFTLLCLSGCPFQFSI